MRFWDSSAVVPLLVQEEATARAGTWYEEDPVALAWWGTPVECMSALARLERDGALAAAAMSDAVERLQNLQEQWHEVQPLEVVREVAQRMLRVHALRAMGSLQLAAAMVAAENRPRRLAFVCLDARLAAAARKEGFTVLGA